MLIQRTIAIPLNLAPSLLLPSLPVEPKDFSDSVPSISQHFPLFERGVFPHECAEKATADDESCFTLKGLSDNDMRFALAPGQTFDKGLGGGFRGNVAQCVSETGQDVAVKRYREKDVELAENSFKVSKELLENEHVVKLIAHGKIQNRPALAMELLDGDIMPLVENEEYKGKEKETAFKDVANQFLDGLAYMHSKRIAHTDFHEANIGLKGNTVKIIDFDFACVNKECITGVAGGKKGYASPEALGIEGQENQIDPLKNDVWEAARVFIQMTTADSAPRTNSDEMRAIWEPDDPNKRVEQIRKQWPEYSPEFAELLGDVFCKEKERINMEKLKEDFKDTKIYC